MDNATLWIIQILAAHLLTDFVLQPKAWVISRKEKHLLSKEFWLHITLTAIVAGWFTCFDTWWLPFVIFITHGLIDWWKSYRNDNTLYFVIDQLLHLIVIFIIGFVKFPDAYSPSEWFQPCMMDQNFWIIGIALVFLTNPVGIIIGMLTKQFRNQIANHNEQSLSNAGTWIGILERLIIFLLVLIDQFEAIGLLVAAKSIVRLKEGEQKMSEYVLVGTLISISVAILTGFIVSKLI